LFRGIGMRASTDDAHWAFLLGRGRDLAEIVFAFKFVEKRENGDLREARKAKLLEVGLELKVLRLENNGWDNLGHWGVIVDDQGKVIEGGVREAVRKELVTEGKLCFIGVWRRWGTATCSIDRVAMARGEALCMEG